MDLATLKQKMDEAHYVYDDTLATVLAVSLALGRPLLIEGAAGVGKTEIVRQVAEENGFDAILTAHHADDNAETVLLNLLRGTGTAGLGGIPAVRGNICRPFLSLTRETLAAYAAEHGIPHVEDATNEEEIAARNILRRRVMPVLRDLNPRAAEHISRAAALAAADSGVLDALAAETAAISS